MFKEKIRQISKDITKNLSTEKDSFNYYNISELNIDEYVINFIQAEINWWIFEDRIVRKCNKSFDFNGLDNIEINNEIDDIYRMKAKISIKEIEHLIEKAVILRANYLIRPKNTLLTFCFVNDAFQSIEILKSKLSFFDDYSYLISELGNWLKNKEQNSNITKHEFDRKITEIENDYIKELDGIGFIQLLGDIWKYFEDEKTNEIPNDVIILFLEDKNLFDLARQVEDYCEGKEKQAIIPQDMQDFLMEINSLPESSNPEQSELIDMLIIDEPEIIINELRNSLNTFVNEFQDENVNQNEAVISLDNLLIKDTIDFNELLTDNDELNEDSELNQILEADDGNELSAEDIDAIFNQKREL
jgi:hypothetical protein